MDILLLAQNSAYTRAKWIDPCFFFHVLNKRQLESISTLLQESI